MREQPPETSASDTFWFRLTHGARRVCASASWQEVNDADWVEHIMGVAISDRFHAKQGRSTCRWIPSARGRSLTVYLKRHYRLPWWRGWLAMVWPGRGWSPALEEWQHLEWARAHGFPVPAAVAAGEFIGPWGRLQSFLAVEELTGMLPLHEAIPTAQRLLSPPRFRAWKLGLVHEVAQLARNLHERNYFHKDLYLCHFYVPETCLADDSLASGASPWRGKVHMIDLHRLGHHPVTWRLWLVKDLAQLLYSSEVAGVEPRDRLVFWKAYLGENRRSWSTSLLATLVRFKWRRYRRHNDKKSPRHASDRQAA